MLQLSYVDKFLNDVHLEFRDRYKNELVGSSTRLGTIFEFGDEYRRVLALAEEWGRSQLKMPKQMRTFEDSMKSKKTVASMIEKRGGEDVVKKSVKIVESVKEIVMPESSSDAGISNEDIIIANRRKLAEKLTQKKKGVEK